MIKIELIRYALANLRKRRRRSLLTMLSVVIGIAAITTLISFGYGVSDYVASFSEKMGKDKLIIQPRGAGFGPPPLDSNVRLDKDDLETIRNANGVQEATGVYLVSGEIEFNEQKRFAMIFGSDFEDYPKLLREVYSLTLLEGRELQNEKTKVVLGYNYRVKDKIFRKPVELRDRLSINGKDFSVLGFYDAVGNPQDDSNIYATKKAAEEIFGANNYQFILARAAPGKDPTQLVEALRKKLRDHRGQEAGTEDFFVQTFEQVIATFNLVLNAIIGVVLLVALISVVVAAVNIMNTMFASILERTNEIGVLKAIGSRNRDILFLFVFESGLLSFAGGVIGVLLGYLLSTLAGKAIATTGYSVFQPLFTWQLAAGSFAFAFLVGAFAGLFPAYRASQMKPIEALRYE